MSSAPLTRLHLVSFGVVSLFSLIVLGLSAHLTNVATTYFGIYLRFAALGIATSLLSLLTLPAIIYIDNIRKGVSTSKIATELVLLHDTRGFLWVLWLATAADTDGFGTNCGRFGSGSRLGIACSETAAVRAFGYLSWSILLTYFGVLLFFAATAAVRGHKDTWFYSVKEADFNFASAPPAAAATPAAEKPQPHYDPTIAQNSQQQVYPPKGFPAPGWAGQPAQAPSYPQV
ncbi:hypothetical protein DXG03_005306 [Asterophora parasitica]|uniref:MARVEL domain-containing protein n=1 Tax=Asterophora parasitica TaxID=117018 RepID=A0A9P7GA43_9AGAR|nr:hypothetical protein DXG03_005306 [Asterophora parasitica]